MAATLSSYVCSLQIGNLFFFLTGVGVGGCEAYPAQTQMRAVVKSLWIQMTDYSHRGQTGLLPRVENK